MNLLAFLWRDLKSQSRFIIIFVVNLSLGLIGFLLVDSFEASVQKSFQTKSRDFLMADLAISKRGAFSPKTKESFESILPKNTKSSFSTEAVTMLQIGNLPQLVNLTGIDSAYPLYGNLKVENKAPLQLTSVWVARELLQKYPDILIQPLKIGDQTFRVAGVVTEDKVNSGFSGFAPKIYLSNEGLQATGLLGALSTETQYYYFRLPDSTDVEKIQKDIFANMDDSSVRITNYKEANEQVSRVFSYLNDYLGLVSLVAILLASLGAVFLFRNDLVHKISQFAIYKSLGIQNIFLQKVILCRMWILSLIAAVFSYLILLAISPLFTGMIQTYVSSDFIYQISFRSFVVALFMAFIITTLIGTMYIRSIRNIKPSLLLREESVSVEGVIHFQKRFFVLPILVFWGLAIYQSHSYKMGSVFMAFIFISAILLYLVAHVLLNLLAKVQFKTFTWKYAALYLTRSKYTSIFVFVSIAMSVLLFFILPQVKNSLLSDLLGSGEAQPTFFLFDVQEEQVDGLKQLLKKEGYPTGNLSPMIRARISQVNGKKFQKSYLMNEKQSREEQENDRSRNRAFNLSYRSHLSSAEKIIEGEGFDPESKIPQVSLEYRFAERIGVKIGDQLKFEIEGVEIDAQVQNFRKVKWTTFQPNFFILFQEGPLSDAPKIFLGTIAGIPENKKIELSSKIVQEFPNISVLDISEVISKVSGLIAQFQVALNTFSWLCLLSGCFVVISIALHLAESRLRDYNLQKMLGVKTKTLLQIFMSEFFLISFFSGLVGLAFSFFISFLLTYVFFDVPWLFDLHDPLWILVCLICMSLVLSALSSYRVLRKKPREVLLHITN